MCWASEIYRTFGRLLTGALGSKLIDPSLSRPMAGPTDLVTATVDDLSEAQKRCDKRHRTSIPKNSSFLTAMLHFSTRSSN